MSVEIIEDSFGTVLDPITFESSNVRRFTLTNSLKNTTVQIITLGATITSIKVPDARGKIDDIVLGYDNVSGYQGTNNPYFGATIGRVCNRVANGKFTLNGKEINVSKNWNNRHQLHGGFIGFDKYNWEVTDINKAEGSVTMKHVSPDGHEGYPGQLTTSVTFKLHKYGSFQINFEAVTTKTTVVNLTNHSYFNLAGHTTGSEEIYKHCIEINANMLTITDSDSIPTGEFKNVRDTEYDFRALENLGDKLTKLLPIAGYDDNYCVNLDGNQTTMIAKVYHPDSGRWMQVSTDQPGVQFYTSNFMPDPKKKEMPIVGKGGAKYWKQGAFCLETQKYPDSMNHSNFPTVVLNPGEKYSHEVVFNFGVSKI